MGSDDEDGDIAQYNIRRHRHGRRSGTRMGSDDDDDDIARYDNIRHHDRRSQAQTTIDDEDDVRFVRRRHFDDIDDNDDDVVSGTRFLALICCVSFRFVMLVLLVKHFPH
jgi:hypothetical protein